MTCRKSMKIQVFPRSYFAEITGTQKECELLETHRIISLNSSSGSAAMPPFSNLRAENLLCITVDDIVWTIRGMTLFNKDHAGRIWDFAADGKLPLMVHCTAGISRSGAVGEALNWYFNSYLQQSDGDFAAFYREHPDITPNPHIRSVLLDVLDRRLKMKNGSCFDMLKRELEKLKNDQKEESKK